MHQPIDPTPATILLPVHGGPRTLKAHGGGRGRHRGAQIVAYALVLNDDFTANVLSKMSWFLSQGYPYTDIKQPDGRWKIKGLHKLVYEHYYPHRPLQPGETVDHKNQDKLNALPANFRPATWSTQMANRPAFQSNQSGFKGVSPRLQTNRKTGWAKLYWVAQVRHNGRNLLQKHFPYTPEGKLQAARAVNAIYREHFPHVQLPNPEAEAA